jgi:nucleotide-binding universal stress UspA family protein
LTEDLDGTSACTHHPATCTVRATEGEGGWIGSVVLRTLLVPVRGDGMVATVLAHAARIAHRHHAHVSVVHCRAEARDMIPRNVAMPGFVRRASMEQAGELADRQEEHLRRILHRLAAEYGLAESAPRAGAATCAFSEKKGRMADVIRTAGRLADAIVLPKPQRERNLGESELKAALYGAGRPVLMCPGQLEPDESFARHVAIGWNGSLPAARAVASSLDIVAAAETVTVLSGGKVRPHGPSVEELITYYNLRGIRATAHHFEAKDPARALLVQARQCGASLLVTGAYSQGQGSDMLFGGNTQKIVDRTEMPILMAH